MPRFTVKELLIAMTFIAMGVGGLLLPRTMGKTYFDSDPAVKAFCNFLFFAGGPLIGAGLFAPFKRPWSGAILGFVIQWVSIFAMLPVVH